MEKQYKIKEIADLFHIPISTLHFWERQGLFLARRNEENGYREFTISDVLNIWEIVFYRDLDIPIQDVKDIFQSDLDKMSGIYAENAIQLERMQQQIQQKIQRIRQQEKLITLIRELQERERQGIVNYKEPNLQCCIEDTMDVQALALTLENPYMSCMYVGREGICKRGICVEYTQGQEYLWENKKENQKYMECLMTMELNDSYHNNIEEIQQRVRKAGFTPGEIIARYLLVAGEAEQRYEYYQAWIACY